MQCASIFQSTTTHAERAEHQPHNQSQPRHPTSHTLPVRSLRIVMRIETLIHLRHASIGGRTRRNQRGKQHILRLPALRPLSDPTFVERAIRRGYRHKESVGESRVTTIVRPIKHACDAHRSLFGLHYTAFGETKILGHVGRYPHAGHIGFRVPGDHPDHAWRHFIRRYILAGRGKRHNLLTGTHRTGQGAHHTAASVGEPVTCGSVHRSPNDGANVGIGVDAL